jgi:hypothetical protein
LHVHWWCEVDERQAECFTPPLHAIPPLLRRLVERMRARVEALPQPRAVESFATPVCVVRDRE